MSACLPRALAVVLLLALSAPALPLWAAEPVVGPELVLDGLPGSSWGQPVVVDTACVPGECLVLWRDIEPWGGDGAVYGARVAATGEVLEPTPVLVAPVGAALAASDGAGTYLAVWYGTEPRPSPAGPIEGTVTRLVAADGSVLGPPRLLSPGDGAIGVGWSGTSFVVVQSGAGGTTATRVAADGTILDAVPIVLDAVGGVYAAIASLGGVTHVVWSRSGSLVLSRIAADGTVLDPVPVPIAEGAGGWPPSVEMACGTTQCLAVWIEDTDPRATRILADGSRVEVTGLPGGGVFDETDDVALVADGDGFLVAWVEDASHGLGRHIETLRVEADGQLTSPGVLGGVGEPYRIELAGTEGERLLVVETWDGTLQAIHLDMMGTPLESAPISPARKHPYPENGFSHEPVAANDDMTLTVWVEPTSATTGDILALRRRFDGSAVDATPLRIATGPLSRRLCAVAGSGSTFAVLWREVGGLMAARVGASGEVVGQPLAIAADGAGFCDADTVVATTNGDYLVAWGQDGVSARFVRNDGTMTDPVEVAPSSMLHAVAASATQSLIVSCRDDRSTVALLGHDGQLHTTNNYIANGSCSVGALEAASDGTDFLLVASPSSGLVIERVLADATVLDYEVLLDSRYGPHFLNVDAVWDGEQYVLGGMDTDHPDSFDATTAPDVLMLRVSASGERLGDPMVLAREQGTELLPDFVLLGADTREVLVTYQRAWRQRGRVVILPDRPDALPLTAETDEDTPVTLTLTATDADGESLAFTITEPPRHGTLSALSRVEVNSDDSSGVQVVYTPHTDYHGFDAFSFTASDGTETSPAALVSLTVHPVGEPLGELPRDHLGELSPQPDGADTSPLDVADPDDTARPSDVVDTRDTTAPSDTAPTSDTSAGADTAPANTAETAPQLDDADLYGGGGCCTTLRTGPATRRDTSGAGTAATLGLVALLALLRRRRTRRTPARPATPRIQKTTCSGRCTHHGDAPRHVQLPDRVASAPVPR